jgi:hypothetical protein
MEWESYDIVEAQDGLTHHFYSIGPKGRVIKKVVKFQHRPELGINMYNLMFGDYEADANRTDDSVVSDNGDHRMILRTVAEIVKEFVNSHPQAIILIRGLTASRSRLYQIGISSAWSEIKEQYNVWGRRAIKWSPFEKGVKL